MLLDFRNVDGHLTDNSSSSEAIEKNVFYTWCLPGF